MQVLARPVDQEAPAQIAATRLLDQWEEAAARVGRDLLANRRMFDFSCSRP